MIIILSEQDQPVTIHPGPQNIVILPSGQASPTSNALSPHETTKENETETGTTHIAKRIIPYAIIALLALWGGLYLFHDNVQPTKRPVTAHNTENALPLPEPQQPYRNTPLSQSAHPAPQGNPNSAFGLN
mgnify:CR=1 FL=1